MMPETPVIGRIVALVPGVQPAALTLDRDRVVLGRLAGVCDVTVDRPTVSRVHAEIVRRGSHFVLVNRSRFRSYVNGAPLTGEQVLFSGDRIGLDSAEPLLQFHDLGDETAVHEPDAAAGRLRLDEATLTFTFDGRPLDLTPQQFTLLRFLYRQRGTVCTRAACEAAVWGENPVVEVSALHRLVSDVRAALRGVGGSAELIVTRRGVGYLLADD